MSTVSVSEFMVTIAEPTVLSSSDHDGMFPTCSLDNLTSCEHFEESNSLDPLYFSLYGIVMTTFIIFGTVGNVLNIITFNSPRIWACLNYYLIALAMWDLALLMTSFSLWSVWSLYFRGATRLFGNHADTLRHAYICGNVTLTGCVWVIVTLTLERYVAILYPLKHRTLDNSCRAKVVLCFVSLGVVLFNSVRPFEVEVIELSCCLPESSLVKPLRMIKPTELRSNDIYFLMYRVLGNMLFIYLAPCAILSLLTLHMCVAVQRAKRLRQSMTMKMLYEKVRFAAQICNSVSQSASSGPGENGSGKKGKNKNGSMVRKLTRRLSFRGEKNINRMLTVVLIKFVVCYSLPTVADILELALPKNETFQRVLEIVTIFSNLLVVLNSSCNFYIYMATGRRFRQECIYILKNFSYDVRSRSSKTVTPLIASAAVTPRMARLKGAISARLSVISLSPYRTVPETKSPFLAPRQNGLGYANGNRPITYCASPIPEVHHFQFNSRASSPTVNCVSAIGDEALQECYV